MARPKGSPNKPKHTLLARLKDAYDLDPIMKLAEVCSKEVPLVLPDGTALKDLSGNPVMIPYLKGSELVTALGKLADKTYATLKSQDLNVSAGDPVVVVDLTGIQEETKTRARRAVAKKRAAKKPAAKKKAPVKRRPARRKTA